MLREILACRAQLLCLKVPYGFDLLLALATYPDQQIYRFQFFAQYSVTITSGDDVTGCNLTPVGRGMPRAPVPFSAVVGRHTAGVALRSDGVQGSAVRARGKGGNKQTVVAKPLFTLLQGGPLGEGEILRGWCP
jgi:hypothetical protein